MISKVQEVISDIIGHQTLYQFEKKNLKYFKHDLNWLNAYAGIRTIYLNIQNLNLFKFNEFHKCSNGTETYSYENGISTPDKI